MDEVDFPNIANSTSLEHLLVDLNRIKAIISTINDSSEALNQSYWALKNITKLISEAEERTSTILYVVYFLTVTYAMIGIMGNILAILSVLLNRTLQNPTNYFLLSLAVVDLGYVMVAALSVPFVFAPLGIIPNDLEWIGSLCLFIANYFLMPASCLHIGLMSIGRCSAIKDPISQRNVTKKRIAMKIGLVWLFILAVPIILLVAFSLFDPFKSKTPFEDLGNIGGVMLFWLAPNLVIAITIIMVFASFAVTTRLLRKLHASMEEPNLTRNVGGQSNANGRKSTQLLQSEKNATKVIWLISFSFIICVTPGTCLFTMFYLSDIADDINVAFKIIIFILYCANPIIDPIIYTMFNKKFRDSFKNLILCRYNELNK